MRNWKRMQGRKQKLRRAKRADKVGVRDRHTINSRVCLFVASVEKLHFSSSSSSRWRSAVWSSKGRHD